MWYWSCLSSDSGGSTAVYHECSRSGSVLESIKLIRVVVTTAPFCRDARCARTHADRGGPPNSSVRRPTLLRVRRLVPGQHLHELTDLAGSRLGRLDGAEPVNQGEPVGRGEDLEHPLRLRVR